jgi:hypothetical protein
MTQFFAPSSRPLRLLSPFLPCFISLVFLSACCCPKSGDNYVSSAANNPGVAIRKGAQSSVYGCPNGTNGTVVKFDDVMKPQNIVFACADDVIVWNYNKSLASTPPVEFTVYFSNKDPFDNLPTATIKSTKGLATSPRVLAPTSDYAAYDYTITVGTGTPANVHIIVLGN